MMKTENKVLMQQARETLAGKWGVAIGASLIYMIVVGASKFVFPIVGPIILCGPMALGFAIFSLNFSRKKPAEIGQVFDGFKRFGQAIIALLWNWLFVFLWTLLLIVPGIIAAISYSQMFFIMADEGIGAKEAMKKSKNIMKGNKWKFVCLGLRFFGWFVLSLLTFGVGFIWLVPYMQIAMTKFYDDITGKLVPNPVI